jgi:hypothetical protein
MVIDTSPELVHFGGGDRREAPNDCFVRMVMKRGDTDVAGATRLPPCYHLKLEGGRGFLCSPAGGQGNREPPEGIAGIVIEPIPRVERQIFERLQPLGTGFVTPLAENLLRL